MAIAINAEIREYAVEEAGDTDLDLLWAEAGMEAWRAADADMLADVEVKLLTHSQERRVQAPAIEHVANLEDRPEPADLPAPPPTPRDSLAAHSEEASGAAEDLDPAMEAAGMEAWRPAEADPQDPPDPADLPAPPPTARDLACLFRLRALHAGLRAVWQAAAGQLADAEESMRQARVHLEYGEQAAEVDASLAEEADRDQA